jgi:hypothetical protein
MLLELPNRNRWRYAFAGLGDHHIDLKASLRTITYLYEWIFISHERFFHDPLAIATFATSSGA